MPRQTYKPIDPQIASLVEEYASSSEAVLEVLTDLQEQRGHLTPAAIADVARAFQIPAEKAYGIASFYSMLQISGQDTGRQQNCRPEADAYPIIHLFSFVQLFYNFPVAFLLFLCYL